MRSCALNLPQLRRNLRLFTSVIESTCPRTAHRLVSDLFAVSSPLQLEEESAAFTGPSLFTDRQRGQSASYIS